MSLNNDTRQNIRSNLDFSFSPTGEARTAGREGSESLRTTSEVSMKEQLEDAIAEIGGEPLAGSGFENEGPDEAVSDRDPFPSESSEPHFEE